MIYGRVAIACAALVSIDGHAATAPDTEPREATQRDEQSLMAMRDEALNSNDTTLDDFIPRPEANPLLDTPPVPVLDKAAYDQKLMDLIDRPVEPPQGAPPRATRKPLYPVSAPYPNAGALLPFHRIVAYYGNFYSKHMGVLGEYPPDVVLEKLKTEVARWNAADPKTPVIPATDYIAVVAQAAPGFDGKYRARMSGSQIEKAIALARQVGGVTFLEVQVGGSNVAAEVPLLEKYLSMPDVELALDPEFDMPEGAAPGTVIGSMSADDINFAANYLSKLVKQKNLPPKILVVHRFTRRMVSNYKQIAPLAEVQIVIDMDGWGFPAKKLNTYNSIVCPEPVQFTGFKLFYKNDLKPPSTSMLTPDQLLKLNPKPVFIQYQ